MTRISIEPTAEQQATVDAVARRDPAIMANAYAGCAKSTTLELAMHQTKVPGITVAFNKRIAESMGRRAPAHFRVSTLNGVGHQAWARAIPAAKIELDARKLGKLVTQVAKDQRQELNEDQWMQTRDLASRAMQVGLVPLECGPIGLVPDDEFSWDQLALDLFVPEGDWRMLTDIAHQVVVDNITLARNGVISFDDQIYCSTLLGGRWPQYPIVFVDEAQDLSTLNHLMLRKMSRSDAQWLVVGDERQAIYAFRGADGDSMRNLMGYHEGPWTELKLTTTFRCPRVVVERNQRHAPGFVAAAGNVEGQFVRFPLRNDTDAESPLDKVWTFGDLCAAIGPGWEQRDIAMLCRHNAPLLSMAFALLRKNIGVTMLGRDIGKGLIALSRQIAKDDGAQREAVASAIDEWEAKERALLVAHGREDRETGAADRAACLRAVLMQPEAKTAGDLRKLLEKLFSRDGGQITLGSIHRAKGLEWDAVVHLDPWRIPSRSAKEADVAGDPIPLQQELNLRYVAETRTRALLVNASVEDFR